MELSNLPQAELLRRYLDGSITEPDAEQLFAWIKENSIEDIADFEAVLHAYYDQSFKEPSQVSPVAGKNMLDKLLSSINEHAEELPVPSF